MIVLVAKPTTAGLWLATLKKLSLHLTPTIGLDDFVNVMLAEYEANHGTPTTYTYTIAEMALAVSKPLTDKRFDLNGDLSVNSGDLGMARNFGVPETTPPPPVNDFLQLPGAVDSVWRKPIGASAVLLDAKIPRRSAQDYETEVIIATPGAPLRDICADDNGWWPGCECNAAMPNRGKLPIPDGFTVKRSDTEGSLPNLACGIVTADGKKVQEMQYATRCASTGPMTAGRWCPGGLVSIDGSGVGDLAHGGSGLSGFFGSLRAWEVNAGRIDHTLKITLGAEICGQKGYQWPALRADSGWNQSGSNNYYGGPVRELCMGALLTTRTDMSGAMRTTVGKMIARAVFVHGIRVADTGPHGYDARALYMAREPGANGGAVTALNAIAAYGTPWGSGNLDADWLDLTSALCIVTNDSATNIGGGGAPRA